MDVTEISCRGLVNRTGGFLAGFTHTINPYRGCSLGGTLCGLPDYAPAIMEAWGEKRRWGSYLHAKVNAPDAYERDHDRIRAGDRPDLRIYMSSVTDPYVPQERSFRITRGILERMRGRPPDLLALQTHTPNPLWDADLLVDLSRRFPLSLQITVETDLESLGDPFPPHAYSIERRLEALERLTARGLETVGVVAPLWPIRDIEGFARRLEAACRFVVVDHFLVGDGSKDGVRTRHRVAARGATFPQMLERAGYGEWTSLESLERVAGIFRAVLGEDRVGISREGFHRAAHRLLAGDRMETTRGE